MWNEAYVKRTHFFYVFLQSFYYFINIYSNPQSFLPSTVPHHIRSFFVNNCVTIFVRPTWCRSKFIHMHCVSNNRLGRTCLWKPDQQKRKTAVSSKIFLLCLQNTTAHFIVIHLAYRSN